MKSSKNMDIHLTNTAESGKRVEMTADTNSLRLYDDDDNLIIDIDDDQAVADGTTYNSYTALYNDNNEPLWISKIPTDGGFLYIYRNMDMGISIGIGPQSELGYTALGRKVIFTTGKVIAASIDGSEATEMSKDHLRTTGKLIATDATDTLKTVVSKEGVETTGDFKGENLLLSGSIQQVEGIGVVTGWSGTITTIRSSTNVITVRINFPTPLFGSWTRNTYKNGILVNVENEIT